MTSQGNTAVRVMYADEELMANGPQGKEGNDNPLKAATVGDNGSAMQLTITIGSAQFPIVVSTEDFWDPVAPVAFVPIALDLASLSDSDWTKMGIDSTLTRDMAIDTMEVSYLGVLSNLEVPDDSVAFGANGGTVGRAKNTPTLRADVTAGINKTRVMVGRHNQDAMKRLKNHIAFASLSCRRRFDRPLHRGRRFTLALSQLPYPQYVMPLVVMVHVSFVNNSKAKIDISVPFTCDNFAVAYRLEATASLVFPQTSIRLNRVRPGDNMSLLVSDPGVVKGPLAEWVDGACKYQNDPVAMKDQEAKPAARKFRPASLTTVCDHVHSSVSGTHPTVLIPGRNRLISRVDMGRPVRLSRSVYTTV